MPGEDENDAGAKAGGVVEDGVEDLVEEAVAQGQLAAVIVELVEAVDDALFGGRDFDRLDSAEELADETGDDAGGAAAGAAIFVDSFGGCGGNDGNDDEGYHCQGRVGGADADHDDQGDDVEGDGTEQVVDPQGEERNFKDIAAEAGNGFAGGIGQG